MSNNGKNLQAFDRFRIDLERKVLWCEEEPVIIPPKAVEILCELVERRGEVVTKDELLSRVWHGSFVEENVLAQNIHYLRKAFKEFDLDENPIQTIPRRGYRFAGKISEPPDEIILEHEVVERELFAEISEDSLRDLGLQHDGLVSSVSTLFKRYRVAALLLFLIAAVSLTFANLIYGPRSPGTAGGIGSVAILPLSPLGEPNKDETLSLGLADALISELGRLNKFAVRPFTAVEKYYESGADAIDFGRRLNVDAVIEGTIHQTDNRLRVNLRLIDVRNGTQVWSDRFDETESDVLKLQDAIANRVARALLESIDPRDEVMLAKSPTTSADAFQYYLMGRERWLRRDLNADSIAFYRKAIELDPRFALAWLGMADQYAFSPLAGTLAESSLNQAISLDPDLADAHATRGFLRMFHHWDWHGAEESFRRALELAPNSSKAHHWYGVYLSLRGRLDEAKMQMEKALELDPTAAIIMTDIAELHYFRRDYDRAETELLNVSRIDPTFINARMHLIKTRYKKGSSFFLESAAFDVFLKGHEGATNPEAERIISDLKPLLARRDEKKLMRIYLNSLQASDPIPHFELARHYIVMGEAEKSFTELEKAFDGREFLMPFIAIDPLWDGVRDHPRFKRLVERMGLSA